MAEQVLADSGFVVGRDRLDAGLLSESDGRRVADVLRRGGFVVLPSDTAFSVAALPTNATIVGRINDLLRRPDLPVSLAFGHVRDVRRWVRPDPVVERLVEEFCPGPITVVCRGASNIPDVLLNQTVASRNRTIGVRLSGSPVERQVAALTAYPVTTVAVRVPETGALVKSLSEALHMIRDRVRSDAWCAIDGDIDVELHSTVVEVVRDDRRVLHRRAGAIPFARIRAVADSVDVVPDGDDHA